MEATIIDQMNKFLVNCLNFELDLKKLGKTKIKTKSKNKAGIIFSNPILTIPKIFGFLEKLFYTWIRFFIFYFSKAF